MIDKEIIKNNKGITVIALILVIIILILASIFIFKITNLENKEEKRQELQDLINKDHNITNFMLNIKKDNGKGEITESKVICKDNISIIILNNGKSTCWTNKETKEQIIINNESNLAVINEDKDILSILRVDDIEQYSLKNVNYTYTYKKMEKNKKRMCYVVEPDIKSYTENNIFYQNVDENEINKISAETYIDAETGLIVKEVARYNNMQAINEYDFEINCVTDKNVEKPDLTGYKIEYFK